MQLKEKIKEILELEKFSNLSDEEKEFSADCIFANCLILSPELQERFLKRIRENVSEITYLGHANYEENNRTYGGIVSGRISNTPSDAEGYIFPLSYQLKYRKFSKGPLTNLTASAVHEWGHVVVKIPEINLLTAKSQEGRLHFDYHGLVISDSLKKEYGHMFNEITNELTNFLSTKAFLSYQETNEEAEEKMRRFAMQNHLTYTPKKPLEHILPENIFTSYTETHLSKDQSVDAMSSLFNKYYTKYGPLVKVVMHAFQNPRFSPSELNIHFANGEGLAATQEGIPVNDFFYGYYESSFHTQDIFNKYMENIISWREICEDFDKRMYEGTIDEIFVTHIISMMTNFYEKRVGTMQKERIITEEMMQQRLAEFAETTLACRNAYEQQILPKFAPIKP